MHPLTCLFVYTCATRCARVSPECGLSLCSVNSYNCAKEEDSEVDGGGGLQMDERVNFSVILR